MESTPVSLSWVTELKRSSPNPATDAAAGETCLSSEPDEVKFSKSFLKVTKGKKKSNLSSYNSSKECVPNFMRDNHI